MWDINASQGRILCAIFTQFAECVPRFSMQFFLFILANQVQLQCH